MESLPQRHIPILKADLFRKQHLLFAHCSLIDRMVGVASYSAFIVFLFSVSNCLIIYVRFWFPPAWKMSKFLNIDVFLISALVRINFRSQIFSLLSVACVNVHMWRYYWIMLLGEQTWGWILVRKECYFHHFTFVHLIDALFYIFP